ncbi:helix-turn-helix transcriptional regulator [Niallia sp. JL1B1071]|uniref:helix-turn-helix transcriptional regulator n=1 Tax=Niallia tiangongensis TaxID=3237105 RepID=UPI0037DC07CE
MKSQIGEIRKAKGLMQKYVAQQVGISHQQLSDFENNRTYPRIDKAYKIAKILNCTVNDFYIWED